MTKSVLVLGGDGFCGWPTTLRLASSGVRVALVDNGARRRIDAELGASPLIPIQSLKTRLASWEEVSGKKIDAHRIDLATDYSDLCDLLAEIRPDVIAHFAEQRSAPYSMESPAGARYSVDNNVRVTHNLLAASVETGLDPHIVHLGTIGVYGYASAGLQLPEGYLPITAHGVDGRKVDREILYPTRPDSVYHLTKCLDQQLFEFYARYHGLRITDLHQGIVWGTQIQETALDDRLVNRFDHDTVYGTVVNRFISQAIAGKPLTVFGSGAQKRAFIHIEDVVEAIVTAMAVPPEQGDRVKIINQVAETCTVGALAEHVSRLTGAPIDRLANPRIEPEHNEFDLEKSTLPKLGLNLRSFDRDLAAEIGTVRHLIDRFQSVPH